MTMTEAGEAAQADGGMAWRPLAACLGLPKTIIDCFFPDRGETDKVDRAKMICMDCKVIKPCFEYAMATNQETGVWGGMATEQRDGLRKKWRSGADIDPLATMNHRKRRGRPRRV